MKAPTKLDQYRIVEELILPSFTAEYRPSLREVL